MKIKLRKTSNSIRPSTARLLLLRLLLLLLLSPPLPLYIILLPLLLASLPVRVRQSPVGTHTCWGTASNIQKPNPSAATLHYYLIFIHTHSVKDFSSCNTTQHEPNRTEPPCHTNRTEPNRHVMRTETNRPADEPNRPYLRFPRTETNLNEPKPSWKLLIWSIFAINKGQPPESLV